MDSRTEVNLLLSKKWLALKKNLRRVAIVYSWCLNIPYM